MSHPNPRNVCDGCGQTLDRRRRGHVLLGPIVHDEIWRRLAKPTAALCWQCMLERGRVRLGRMLRLADLQPCPWNLFHRPYSWFDLFVEMEGLPPTNLAAWRAAWRVIGEPGDGGSVGAIPTTRRRRDDRQQRAQDHPVRQVQGSPRRRKGRSTIPTKGPLLL